MGQIVFVEVKTRRTMRYGTPQEAVTASKQINLRHAAVQWLTAPEHRMPNSGVRFDVVTVVVQGDRPLLHYIEESVLMAIGSALSLRTDRFESLHRPDSSVRIPWTSLFLHHRPARHLIVRGARTGQVGMPGKWFQMAGNPCHGQSLPSVHAEERLFA